MTSAASAAAAAASAAAVAASAAASVAANQPMPRVPRDAPTGGSLARPRGTVRPPPTEYLARQYFTPLVTPTPVATRAPQPAKTADTINGFLRLEAGGGVLRGEMLLWDVAVILHAYANNSDEYLAEQLINDALAWGANAAGYTQQMPNGDEWFITYSRATSIATRKADPYVNMTRYRGMVTWRIPGLPPNPIGTRAAPVTRPAIPMPGPTPTRRR